MESSIHKSMFGVAVVFAVGGCVDMSIPQTFDDQVAEGADLYAMHCASCHGSAGEGVRGMPALVGIDKGALPLEPREGSRRNIPFTTVADVAMYTEMYMPPRGTGDIPSEQYWAIIAFSMHENGIISSSALDHESAQTMIIPR